MYQYHSESYGAYSCYIVALQHMSCLIIVPVDAVPRVYVMSTDFVVISISGCGWENMISCTFKTEDGFCCALFIKISLWGFWTGIVGYEQWYDILKFPCLRLLKLCIACLVSQNMEVGRTDSVLITLVSSLIVNGIFQFVMYSQPLMCLKEILVCFLLFIGHCQTAACML